VTNDKTHRSKTGTHNQGVEERDRHVIVLTMESDSHSVGPTPQYDIIKKTNPTSLIDKVKNKW